MSIHKSNSYSTKIITQCKVEVLWVDVCFFLMMSCAMISKYTIGMAKIESIE